MNEKQYVFLHAFLYFSDHPVGGPRHHPPVGEGVRPRREAETN